MEEALTSATRTFLLTVNQEVIPKLQTNYPTVSLSEHIKCEQVSWLADNEGNLWEHVLQLRRAVEIAASETSSVKAMLDVAWNAGHSAAVILDGNVHLLPANIIDSPIQLWEWADENAKTFPCYPVVINKTIELV